MVDVIIGLVFLVAGLGWLPFLIYAFKRKDCDSVKLPKLLVVTLVFYGTAAAFAWVIYGPFHGLISLFAPLLALLYFFIQAFVIEAYVAIISAILLTFLFYAFVGRLHGVACFVASASFAIVLLLIPLAVQSPWSNQKTLSAFEEMNGDCLSHLSFWNSVFNSDNNKVSHAVMFRGDDIFVWSYTDQRFNNTKDGRYQPGYALPNGDCTGQ